MNILIVDTKVNKELLQELRREYITDTYSERVESLLSDIANEFDLDVNGVFSSNLFNEIYNASIYVIDKIILDNIYKYIASNNINRFIDLINNNSFSMDLFVNHFYIKQILDIITKYFNFIEDEMDSLAYILIRKIGYMIDCIYKNNTRFINPVLMKVFDTFHNSLGYINVSYYKFELDSYNRPMFMYSSKNISFHT